MANDPQPEVDVSLSSSGGLGYFTSAFGFRGGIVGASFATALPGDPSLPNSTTFGDQILASAGWLQEPGQPNGDHTTHTNPYTDDILFSLNVPLDIQERFGKRDMLSLIPKDRHVEEWWVGGIYRHSAWQVGNTFYYVVTHEPKEWFIFSGGVTTIATAQFRFDGTEIGRDLALEELRNSQVLNNLGTTALAAQENGQAAGMVLLTITTTVTPFPDEGLLILAAGKKGFDVVKAGRASYHIYRDGKRLTGQAESDAAKLIMDEASNDVAPSSGGWIDGMADIAKLARGRKGGAILDSEWREQLVAQLKSLDPNLKLRIDDDLLELKGLLGGFQPESGTVILRSDATLFEAVHELGHAKYFADIGSDAAKYLGLRRQISSPIHCR
jgi:hypothetical protein